MRATAAIYAGLALAMLLFGFLGDPPRWRSAAALVVAIVLCGAAVVTIRSHVRVTDGTIIVVNELRAYSFDVADVLVVDPYHLGAGLWFGQYPSVLLRDERLIPLSGYRGWVGRKQSEEALRLAQATDLPIADPPP